MAVNVYEGMFILDSNRYSRDSEAVSGQIPKMIEAAGGEILVSRMWEERRLAYPIDGHRKGSYWLTYFRADGGSITALERDCRLSDTIIRALFLKVDPRIVDTLVAHAQEEPAKALGKGDADDAKKPGAKEPGADGGDAAPSGDLPSEVAEETA